MVFNAYERPTPYAECMNFLVRANLDFNNMMNESMIMMESGIGEKFKNLLRRIAEWFKKLAQKIKSIFSRSSAKVQEKAKEAKAKVIEINVAQLLKEGKLKGLEFKCHTFENLESAPKQMQEAIDGSKESNDDLISAIKTGEVKAKRLFNNDSEKEAIFSEIRADVAYSDKPISSNDEMSKFIKEYYLGEVKTYDANRIIFMNKMFIDPKVINDVNKKINIYLNLADNISRQLENLSKSSDLKFDEDEITGINQLVEVNRFTCTCVIQLYNIIMAAFSVGAEETSKMIDTIRTFVVNGMKSEKPAEDKKDEKAAAEKHEAARYVDYIFSDVVY